MRRSFIKPTRLIAGLLVGLMFAILAIPLGAETATGTHARTSGFAAVYDVNHEVTINGTLRQVVTRHTKGSPAGMHLLITGTDGIVDAHIGNLLTKAQKDSIHEGMPVRIVGAMSKMHGKSYLMARQVTVGGHLITVRNTHGALVLTDVARRKHGKPATKTDEKVKTAKLAVDGGVR